MSELYNIYRGALPLFFYGGKHFLFSNIRHIPGKDHGKLAVMQETTEGMGVCFFHGRIRDWLVAVKRQLGWFFFIKFIGI